MVCVSCFGNEAFIPLFKIASSQEGVAISVDHNTHLGWNAAEAEQSTRTVSNLAWTGSETLRRDL